ncbi:nascent polypeptide-associated complex protein [Halobacteriales archaeon QS_1_68_20]|nr:MAG: nascent polypeptide-associated complex protein [Halobacteriales archaeon QS_1_68_20]
MFGGGGGLDPRKMQQMMEQMGVDFDELDATEVLVRMEDGEELYFDGPEVNRIEAQGQTTYQVVGEPERRESAAGEATDEGAAGSDVPEEDVEIVAQRTGASDEAAREALEETGGDLAAAVERLE